MARILSLSDVGIFTGDQEAAKKFYVEKVGLKVRSSQPEFGYLSLGTTEEGSDASIDVWQPGPDWGDEYEDGARSIGTVTGLGFRTGNLNQTLKQLSKRGVRIEKDTDTFARFWDIDGNVIFIQEDPEAKGARTGLIDLGWVTVVCRDVGKAGKFFRTLGLESAMVPGEEAGEEGYMVYRVTPEGTAILPFAPDPEMYEDPADYDSDVAHIGENTAIMFLTDDAYGLQDELLSKGTAFRKKAEERPWGGVAMHVYDADKNHYMIVQMKA